MEQTLKPLQIAVGKIECTENKGETIYRIFGRDKFLNKQCINVYNFLPYFYLPQHTSVIKDKNLVRIEKTNKLTMDNIHVKKVYMKNWKALGLYDDNGYCKKYSKTYETDVDESNRLAIDLNIKSGVRVYNEEVDFGKDKIEPVDFKIDLRRVHLDIEVSTKLTNKLPDWENPIEPIYTLANFDTYTEKFTYFVQHPEYKNKTYYNTTYSPDLKHIITIKINSLKKQLSDLDVTYKRVKDMKIKIEEITDDQLDDIGDLIIYFFKYEKLKSQIDSFNSRLENIIKSFKPKYKVKFITFDNEKDMLEHYIKYIDKIDPDIITGWNSQGFDIPYIIARMQKLQVDARKLSPINNVYIKKKQGIGIIRGRVVFDTWKGFKKQQTHGLESYKLDFVAQTLFAVGKVEHEGINKMYDEDRMLLAKYNIQDVFLEYAISKDQGIFEFFYDVKCYAGCSFEDVLDNSHIVDTYMLFKARDQNMVLPNKPVVYSEESFEGATVFTPNKIGIQHW
jgi:DNA polymerase elongation subunit (family B)